MYIARHESILMSAGHSFVVFLVSNVMLTCDFQPLNKLLSSNEHRTFVFC